MTKHPIVHFEVGCYSGDDTRTYFSKLFSWNVSDRATGVSIDTGGDSDVSGHIVELAEKWGNYVTVYVEVDDLELYLEKAEDLGRKTLVGQTG